MKLILFALFILLASFMIICNLSILKHLDDVSPDIPCDEELLKSADFIFVIPKFNNHSIAENKEWCQYILSLNKPIAMHGVYHTYNEFLEDRNESYLQEGIDAFRQCFGFEPHEFKSPQLKISKKNIELIRKKMALNTGKIVGRSYHCNQSFDRGRYAVRIK